jgi:imidazolonepropionase-like amidohydrolase
MPSLPSFPRFLKVFGRPIASRAAHPPRSTTMPHPTHARRLRARRVAACLFALGLLPALPTTASDQVPGKSPPGPTLLRGADVYTVSGDVARGGWVLIDGGKIARVGTAKEAPPELPKTGTSVDLAGKRLYPGLIAVGNDLGLVEIPSVRASRDSAETGQINPNARAEAAVNPDSELIPVTRSNGVLLNLTVPTGGLISGTGAVLQLDGWTWEDMTVKAPVGLQVAWPRMTVGRPTRGDDDDDGPPGRRPKFEEQIRAIEQAFDDARAYAAARAADRPPPATVPATAPATAANGGAAADGRTDAAARPPARRPQARDARWEAMLPVLDGRVSVFVWADELRQIQSAVAFAARQKVRLVIVGGYDAAACADLLKERKVPVVISGTQRLPQRRDAGYDDAYTLPERLRQAGVGFCISYGGRFASNVRNLPYHAAAAAAHGLPPAEALRAITLYPAQILGVADRVGSIEPGKDATLVVADGDLLETPTHVERAYVRGRPVDLSNRQTQLWQKYQQKYNP